MICFAAHPDDETIGAGGQLPFLADPWIVHATDGAPLNMEDARAHGFETREAYAGARRAELRDALQIAGIPEERALTLGLIDQQCAHELPWLIEQVAALLRRHRPESVLSPPYEGGHPDHDSLAFAVHAACRLLAAERLPVPRIVEHALYHGGRGHFEAGAFLPFPEAPVTTIPLGSTISGLKRKMLDCYSTQRDTLRPFQSEYESFRIAPDYNFASPPHPGRLYYENFHWGVTGEQWRALAAEASRRLGLEFS